MAAMNKELTEAGHTPIMVGYVESANDLNTTLVTMMRAITEDQRKKRAAAAAAAEAEFTELATKCGRERMEYPIRPVPRQPRP